MPTPEEWIQNRPIQGSNIPFSLESIMGNEKNNINDDSSRFDEKKEEILLLLQDKDIGSALFQLLATVWLGSPPQQDSDELESVEDNLEDSSPDSKQFEEKIKELEQSNENWQKEAKEYHSKGQELEKLLLEAKKLLIQQSQELERHKNTIHQSQTEILNLRGAKQDLHEENTMFDNDIKALLNQNNTLTHQCEMLKKEYQESLRQHELEKASIFQKLQELEQHNQEITLAYQQLCGELSSLKTGQTINYPSSQMAQETSFLLKSQ